MIYTIMSSCNHWGWCRQGSDNRFLWFFVRLPQPLKREFVSGLARHSLASYILSIKCCTLTTDTGDYLMDLVKTSPEATWSRFSAPLIVCRDSFNPRPWARFQIEGGQPMPLDMFNCLWYLCMNIMASLLGLATGTALQWYMIAGSEPLTSPT